MTRIMYKGSDYTGREKESMVTTTTPGLMYPADKIKLNNLPNVHISSSEPTSSDGINGDIWFKYE